jgi:undecaprenyl diphosphate synthase
MAFEPFKTTKSDMHGPRHVAITIEGNLSYAKKKGMPIPEVYKKIYLNLREILMEQVRLNIPLLTIKMLPTRIVKSEHFPEILEGMIETWERMAEDAFIQDNKIKITILGKWYDLSGRAVDAIKNLIDKTKEHDAFQVHLCINYDGQEEIVDACRMVGIKIKAGKLDPEAITKTTIKENTYALSPPPDLIIFTGKSRRLDSFLLWDSGEAKTYFSDRYWPDFGRKDFLKALDQ